MSFQNRSISYKIFRTTSIFYYRVIQQNLNLSDFLRDYSEERIAYEYDARVLGISCELGKYNLCI